MKKVVVAKKRHTRQYKSNPHSSENYGVRVKKSKSINYENNSKIYDVGNGYSRIEAIDRTKLF